VRFVPVAGNATLFEMAVDIGCPRRSVFALLADIQDHEPIPRAKHVRMVKLPSTATRLGSWWDEHVRLIPGVWLTIQSVVTELEEPTTMGMDFHSRWFDGHLTYTLQPSGSNTTLHQHETIRLRWPLSWFPGHVERTLRKQLGTRLVEIRSLAETESRHHVRLGP
jgi:hypothetical protein